MEDLNELEKAQTALQLTMKKYNCTEEKARELLKEMNIPLPGLDTVSVPAFNKRGE